MLEIFTLSVKLEIAMITPNTPSSVPVTIFSVDPQWPLFVASGAMIWNVMKVLVGRRLASCVRKSFAVLLEVAPTLRALDELDMPMHFLMRGMTSWINSYTFWMTSNHDLESFELLRVLFTLLVAAAASSAAAVLEGASELMCA